MLYVLLKSSDLPKNLWGDAIIIETEKNKKIVCSKRYKQKALFVNNGIHKQKTFLSKESEQQNFFLFRLRRIFIKIASSIRTAHKILQCGHYWQNIHKDAHEFAKSCDRCKRDGGISKRQEIPLNPILVIELFIVWGIDLMGPL